MSDWKYIPMRPFGKARPRVTRNGTFMPKDYTSKKNSLKQLYGPIDEYEFINLDFVAIRRIPKNCKSGGKIVTPGTFCTTKPDIDNIAGAIMDALFPDSDSHVVAGKQTKIWGYADCLLIRVTEANHSDWLEFATEANERAS